MQKIIPSRLHGMCIYPVFGDIYIVIFTQPHISVNTCSGVPSCARIPASCRHTDLIDTGGYKVAHIKYKLCVSALPFIGFPAVYIDDTVHIYAVKYEGITPALHSLKGVKIPSVPIFIEASRIIDHPVMRDQNIRKIIPVLHHGIIIRIR